MPKTNWAHVLYPIFEPINTCVTWNLIIFVLKWGHHGKITIYLDRIHQYLCPVKVVIMCPIAHVLHWPCAPSPMCPIPQGTPSLSLILTMIPLSYVAHCPCAPLAMCQKVKNMWSYEKDVKKMSSCQKDVKCQKVKYMDYGGGSQKK